MKRPYELTFIVRIDPNEEVMQESVDQVKTWVEADDKGRINRIDRWGRRRLAYEIDGQREGFYVLFHAEVEPEHINEVERDLKLADNILRYLVVKPD